MKLYTRNIYSLRIQVMTFIKDYYNILYFNAQYILHNAKSLYES